MFGIGNFKINFLFSFHFLLLFLWLNQIKSQQANIIETKSLFDHINMHFPNALFCNIFILLFINTVYNILLFII